MMFSTYDQDNDLDPVQNWAQAMGGGWWFNGGCYGCITCSCYNYDFKWVPQHPGTYNNLDNARMMIKLQAAI